MRATPSAALRINDFTSASDGEEPGPQDGTDEVWIANRLRMPRARALFAAYDQTFAFFEGDGTAGSLGEQYRPIFPVRLVSGSDGYNFEPIQMANFDPSKFLRWGRGEGPPFGPPYQPGPRRVSSKGADNPDDDDHMITYQLQRLNMPPGLDPAPRWVLMFEDILDQEDFFDFDFNDLVIEIEASAPEANRWIGPAPGGSWNVQGNWLGGIPNGDDDVANLVEDIDAATTITIDSPIRIKLLNIRSFSSYTVAGPSTLTFANNPAVTVNAGEHVVSAPVRIEGGIFTATVGRGRELTFMGSVEFIEPAGTSFTKLGEGALELRTLPATTPISLNIQRGTLRLLPGGGASQVGFLSRLPEDMAQRPEATLDITNNSLAFSASGYDLETLRRHVGSAYSGGDWEGLGIGSSMGNASHFGVGYSENLIKYVRYGNANLDDAVDLADFNALASNFGSSDAFWHQGDFNYDGAVGLADFNLLARNFGMIVPPEAFVGPGAGLGGSITPGDWAACSRSSRSQPAASCGVFRS